MGIFSKLFGAGKGKSSDPRVAEIFNKMYTFMMDERIQNSKQPPELQRLMELGGGVDVIDGATGSFGRDANNPIPVNGPIGELIYISNLRLPSGIQIMGHRIGTYNNIDLYETVSFDGTRWDLMFFDFYRMRKSRMLPSGYRFANEPERFLLAANFAVEDFPNGMFEAMGRCTTQTIGVNMVFPGFRDLNLFKDFVRPQTHIRIEEIMARDMASETTEEEIESEEDTENVIDLSDSPENDEGAIIINLCDTPDVDIEILELSHAMMAVDLGAIDDLPSELSNALLYNYYMTRYLVIHQADEMRKRGAQNIKQYIEDYARFTSGSDSIPEQVKILRRIDKVKDPEQYREAVEVLIDIFKFNMSSKDIRLGPAREKNRERFISYAQAVPDLLKYCDSSWKKHDVLGPMETRRDIRGK
ncbi:MAG: hypothetical protein ABIF71_11035 [Planctomycetota bacterium]